jgi:hypothetical protein
MEVRVDDSENVILSLGCEGLIGDIQVLKGKRAFQAKYYQVHMQRFLAGGGMVRTLWFVPM